MSAFAWSDDKNQFSYKYFENRIQCSNESDKKR